MALILFHSSKTMLQGSQNTDATQSPQLLAYAKELASYMQTLSIKELMKIMHLSEVKATQTHTLIKGWSSERNGLPAIDAFLGDMYSGLQASSFSDKDRSYANNHLFILSGLYGVLRALDTISPYRLEMGYRFGQKPYDNLYSFWGDRIASTLPDDMIIFNLSSAEYTKAALPHLTNRTIITPKFYTRDQATGTPKQVVIHSKIARGAYVRWLVKNQISDTDNVDKFSLLGYSYDHENSTPTMPVYICEEFHGLGLSIKLRAAKT